MGKKAAFRQGDAAARNEVLTKPAAKKSLSIPENITKDLKRKKKEIDENVEIRDDSKEFGSSCAAEGTSLSWFDCLPSETKSGSKGSSLSETFSDSEESSPSGSFWKSSTIEEPRSTATNKEEEFEDFVCTVDASLDLDRESPECRKLRHPPCRPSMPLDFSASTSATAKDDRNMMAKFQPASTSTPKDKISSAHRENKVVRKLKNPYSRPSMSRDLPDTINATAKDDRNMVKFHPASTSTPHLRPNDKISSAHRENKVCRKSKYHHSRPFMMLDLSAITNATIKHHRDIMTNSRPISTSNLSSEDKIFTNQRGSSQSVQKPRNPEDTLINDSSKCNSSGKKVSGISLHAELETSDSGTLLEKSELVEPSPPHIDETSHSLGKLCSKQPDSSLVKNKNIQMKQVPDNSAAQVLRNVVPKSRYEKESFHIADVLDHEINYSVHSPSREFMFEEVPITHTTIEKPTQRQKISKRNKNKQRKEPYIRAVKGNNDSDEELKDLSLHKSEVSLKEEETRRHDERIEEVPICTIALLFQSDAAKARGGLSSKRKLLLAKAKEKQYNYSDVPVCPLVRFPVKNCNLKQIKMVSSDNPEIERFKVKTISSAVQ